MYQSNNAVFALLVMGALFMPPFYASAQSTSQTRFILVPDLVGSKFQVEDAADAGVVSGRFANSIGYTEGYMWNVDTNQFITLGDLPGGSITSTANGISENGEVIVGMSGSDKGLEAIRWTSATGMQTLGFSSLGSNRSYANSVSSNGSSITGYARNKNNRAEAYVWNNGSGIQMLGYLPGGSFHSSGIQISSDSTTVVGKSSSSTGLQAFMWTKSGGMRGLGYLPGLTQGESIAHATSNDGGVIVGSSSTPVNSKSVEAFRWTKSDGMQGLGDLPGGDFYSIALDVSGDGKIIVGTSRSMSSLEAFIWDKENGMRSVKSVLESEGISLNGWHLVNAASISSDGTLISGVASDANDNIKAWAARLPDTRNAIPVANAGKDLNASRGEIITLDGSASNDQDGDYPLTYQWIVVSKPADSAIVLSDPISVTPAFIPDVIGDYVLELVVTDNTGRSSDPDQLIVSTINAAPVANAGKDIAIIVHGTVATLNANASSDPEGDPITYHWNMISRPTDSTAMLSDVAAVNPVFVADEFGDYIVQLTVTDEHGAISEPDSVAVSFTNLPPVANAGNDQKDVIVSDTVRLTGTGEDPNNDQPLFYKWKMVSWPSNNPVLLTGASEANISFTPDMPGTYVLELITSDGKLRSEPDSIVVTVITVETAIYNAMARTADTITGLSPDTFRKHRHQNTMLNKLASALGKIDKNKYKSAARHLSRDILRKTNGCSKKGKPDRRDWIIECTAQAKVHATIENVLTLIYRIVPDIKRHDHEGHKHKHNHDKHKKKNRKHR